MKPINADPNGPWPRLAQLMALSRPSVRYYLKINTHCVALYRKVNGADAVRIVTAWGADHKENLKVIEKTLETAVQLNRNKPLC